MASCRLPFVSALVLAALTLLGNSDARPNPAPTSPNYAERATTLVAFEHELDAAACEIGQAALILAGATKWNPVDGPSACAEPGSVRSRVRRGPCSSDEDAGRSPSISLGHLRSNGSADAHGARA